MDSIQQQITTLSTKIDALQQIIEQINARVVEAISAQHMTTDHREGYSSSEMTFMNPRLSVHRGLDAVLEHKDILADDTYIETEGQSAERDMNPTIQIQRLTAQLTAAYNRIAALEEQLLARRVH